MKRSEINQILEESIEFLNFHKFKLPPWAYYSPSDWTGKIETSREIFTNMLGWDITDFGSGDFASCGLILFTLRNGNLALDNKPYAEKILISDKNQITPMHFHWNKMEDIINRGGGNMIIELYGSTEKEELSDEPVTVRIDGVERTVQPGSKVILTPGESICLTQGVYHKFYAEEAKVLLGEVSMVNDDSNDNRFYEPAGRFPEIEEDVKPLHLLASDYSSFIRKQ